MRQGQYFSAHFKLMSYDKIENLWFTFSENRSKMCPQNAWVRIVPPSALCPLVWNVLPKLSLSDSPVLLRKLEPGRFFLFVSLVADQRTNQLFSVLISSRGPILDQKNVDAGRVQLQSLRRELRSFPWKLSFSLGTKRTSRKSWALAPEELFFLNFLALLHYKVFKNVTDSGISYIVGHFVVRKCEKIQKKRVFLEHMLSFFATCASFPMKN